MVKVSFFEEGYVECVLSGYKLFLNPEEREAVAKFLADHLEVSVDNIEVYTVEEYAEQLWNYFTDLGCPLRLLNHVNFHSLIEEMRIAGEIRVFKLRVDEWCVNIVVLEK